MSKINQAWTYARWLFIRAAISARRAATDEQRLVECAIPMTACDDPEPHYKFGVEMFMAGVAALAAARSAQPAS
jgi:hypothetical protein